MKRRTVWRYDCECVPEDPRQNAYVRIPGYKPATKAQWNEVLALAWTPKPRRLLQILHAAGSEGVTKGELVKAGFLSAWVTKINAMLKRERLTVPLGIRVIKQRRVVQSKDSKLALVRIP